MHRLNGHHLLKMDKLHAGFVQKGKITIHNCYKGHSQKLTKWQAFLKVDFFSDNVMATL